MQHKYNQTLT